MARTRILSFFPLAAAALLMGAGAAAAQPSANGEAPGAPAPDGAVAFEAPSGGGAPVAAPATQTGPGAYGGLGEYFGAFVASSHEIAAKGSPSLVPGPGDDPREMVADTIKFQVCKDLSVCYVASRSPVVDIVNPGQPGLPLVAPAYTEAPPVVVSRPKFPFWFIPLIGGGVLVGTGGGDDDTPPEVVPEPATLMLAATGLAGLAAARRRRRKEYAA